MMNCLRVGLPALAFLVAACGGNAGLYDSPVESDVALTDAVLTQVGELLDANTTTEQTL